MNKEKQIIFTFNHVVNENYEQLRGSVPPVLSAKDVLTTLLAAMKDKKEEGYPLGQISFRTPQEAIRRFNSSAPIYYMDKLIILASFARCMNHNFEILLANRPHGVVTYLRVWNPQRLIDSYHLCPGLPFNVHP